MSFLRANQSNHVAQSVFSFTMYILLHSTIFHIMCTRHSFSLFIFSVMNKKRKATQKKFETWLSLHIWHKIWYTDKVSKIGSDTLFTANYAIKIAEQERRTFFDINKVWHRVLFTNHISHNLHGNIHIHLPHLLLVFYLSYFVNQK